MEVGVTGPVAVIGGTVGMCESQAEAAAVAVAVEDAARPARRWYRAVSGT